MKLALKDPISGLTHFVGALLAVAGLVLLVVFGYMEGTAWHVVSFAIFGASMILLYTASTLYHWLPLGEKGSAIMRRIDHMMIYVLIAGTYTPVCLVAIRGGWGWSLFGSIWGLAIAGIVLKIFWLDAPRWLATSFYLFMGWLAVVAFYPLIHSVPIGGIFWLVFGGILYSIGAVIYAVKKPNLHRHFGFHEIFHLFVMAGSFSHFLLMWRYILKL
ncbi:MAG: hemolysin III family protein [Firmicutes bacterium]|nr:hemolysin III family protein [Bacillota bacterium]